MLLNSPASTSEDAISSNGAPVPSSPLGNYRWKICALLFFATTINYLDRQILGILAPTLGKEIGWDEVQYGNIVIAFQAAYAMGLLAAGGLMDRVGTRIGYAASIGLWSIAAMAHAFAHSVSTFSAARFVLGIGEAGNFPAAIKTVAEWFPKRDRALVTGIFNGGSNVGAIVAPIIVPWLTLRYGWGEAFLVTGAIGFIWLVCWLLVYRRPEEHPRLSAGELAYIRSDPPEVTTKVPWLSLLPHRQLWAFALGKMLTDPVWWFYLYWLGKFLDKNYGIKLSQISLPLVVIYLVADFGSVGGGWLSSTFIKRGWGINRGRKTAMLICALCVVPVMFAAQTTSLWVAVGIISLAAAAHQGWSANIFTMVSDMYPRRAVGSVVGIGGMAGALGGIAFTYVATHMLESNGSNYTPIFAVCGFAYLVALAVIHLLAPKLEGPHLGD
ncbi:hexuronate transporter [Abditibacteriota bacterium]|nr:hexuronate transporter [Abditibacteriota bacterium]